MNIIRNSFLLTSAVLLLSSCYDPKEEDDIKPADVIILKSANTSILADGVSKTSIYVYLPQDAAKGKRSVSLETSKGRFQNNTTTVTVEADSIGNLDGAEKRIAKTILQSDVRVGKAAITAKADNYSSKTTVEFTPAGPDSIKVNTSDFSVMASFKSEILLTAVLMRDTGLPSVGEIVKFEVQDSTGAVYSQEQNFREAKLSSDETGKASVIYSPGNISLRGRLFVIASVPAVATIKPDTATVYVYDYEQ